MFLVNIAKFLKTPILKNICKQLLLHESRKVNFYQYNTTQWKNFWWNMLWFWFDRKEEDKSMCTLCCSLFFFWGMLIVMKFTWGMLIVMKFTWVKITGTIDNTGVVPTPWTQEVSRMYVALTKTSRMSFKGLECVQVISCVQATVLLLLKLTIKTSFVFTANLEKLIAHWVNQLKLFHSIILIYLQVIKSIQSHITIFSLFFTLEIGFSISKTSKTSNFCLICVIFRILTDNDGWWMGWRRNILTTWC